ncbi:2Fe-2S ferredoxin [Mycobacteroides abscessus subsp. abscessus]|uniref:2Fe-2S iron-sulfur cluster-binding protein n=1 Tax=Mycobacteroides abscessus TaxID=36809 RepID=UPI0009B180EE|nr:2Fe-2S iron-sulfur cluster-binding protein [Mycobacteroides abscessus]SLK84446.1 2Fe-2S ferredoxin [Mycobacteroides abscessus subsp. abscessus]
MKITFTNSDGYTKSLDAEEGISLMHVAVSHDVPRITADCGGNAMCATCHIYVDDADYLRLPPIADDEDEMLDFTECARRPTSRLACQVQVDNALGAITVEIPLDTESPVAQSVRKG